MDKGVFPGQGNPIRHTTPKILQNAVQTVYLTV